MNTPRRTPPARKIGPVTGKRDAPREFTLARVFYILLVAVIGMGAPLVYVSLPQIA